MLYVQALQELVRHHIESFNFMVDEGLAYAVQVGSYTVQQPPSCYSWDNHCSHLPGCWPNVWLQSDNTPMFKGGSVTKGRAFNTGCTPTWTCRPDWIENDQQAVAYLHTGTPWACAWIKLEYSCIIRYSISNCHCSIAVLQLRREQIKPVVIA